MDANAHAKFKVGQRETWDEKLHKIEEANALRLSKYRCPCF
jgi:hypothetical protein